MNENELMFKGFKKLGDFKLKSNRSNFLFWDCLFAPGESLTIELTYKNDEWKVSRITFKGERAKQRLRDHLTSSKLEDVVSFIEKFPKSTNP